MITLTAKIEINQENPVPFIIGQSVIGGNALIGDTINVTKEFDRRNLLSIERSIFDRSDLKLPSWGIISNVGSLEFNDINSRFLGYANAGLLVEGMKCELFLNNTLVNGANEKIGTFYTDAWDYDNDNQTVSVRLKDDLEEWQDILLEEYPLQNQMTMYEVYEYLLGKTPTKWEFLVDTTTENRLKSIICPYPYLESDNLWAQWQKLCEVCALYVYKNNDGKVILQHKI